MSKSRDIQSRKHTNQAINPKEKHVQLKHDNIWSHYITEDIGKTRRDTNWPTESETVRSLAHLAFNLNDKVTRVNAKGHKGSFPVQTSEPFAKSPVLIALAGILKSLGAMQQWKYFLLRLNIQGGKITFTLYQVNQDFICYLHIFSMLYSNILDMCGRAVAKLMEMCEPSIHNKHFQTTVILKCQLININEEALLEIGGVPALLLCISTNVQHLDWITMTLMSFGSSRRIWYKNGSDFGGKQSLGYNK